MKVTITYKTSESEHIVQIDCRQEIGAGLASLRRAGKIAATQEQATDFFRSSQLGKVVSAYCTFDELGIYSGDVLTAIYASK